MKKKVDPLMHNVYPTHINNCFIFIHVPHRLIHFFRRQEKLDVSNDTRYVEGATSQNEAHSLMQFDVPSVMHTSIP